MVNKINCDLLDKGKVRCLTVDKQYIPLSDGVEKIIDYRGKTPRKLGSDWTKTGIRAISAKNVHNGVLDNIDSIRCVSEEISEKWMKDKIQRNDIFIASEGASMGESLIWESDEQIVLGQRLFAVRANTLVFNPFYLAMYMRTPEYQTELENHCTGTSVMGLSQPGLLRTKIRYIPIERQNFIGEMYQNICNKIAVNSAINRNLEEQAFVLFDSYFPSVMNGESKIGDYITPKRGKNLLSKDAIPGDVPVVAGGLSPSTYHNEPNTVGPVLTISASGANAGYVGLWNQSVWSSDSSYIDSRMTNDVYFWYVMLKKRQKEIFDSQTGSAQPHIYPKHIEGMSVINLDKSTIEDYTKEITPMFRMIGANKQENVRMAELRDSLLPKLMSGELDVSELDI